MNDVTQVGFLKPGGPTVTLSHTFQVYKHITQQVLSKLFNVANVVNELTSLQLLFATGKSYTNKKIIRDKFKQIYTRRYYQGARETYH